MNMNGVQGGMNFKGLWGKSNVTEHINRDGYKMVNVEKSYHPFLDESYDEIHMKKDSAYDSFTAHSKLTGDYYGVEQKAVVEERLPFTKQDWADYTNHKSDKRSTADIEEYLDMFDLSKHIRK